MIVLETTKGTIEIETYPGDAPKTVARILELVKRNFYNGLRFHRAEKRLVQIGDPASRDMSRQATWGQGGSGNSIGAGEITKRRHGPGTVAMAHAGDPKFADSQFYITKSRDPGVRRQVHHLRPRHQGDRRGRQDLRRPTSSRRLS